MWLSEIEFQLCVSHFGYTEAAGLEIEENSEQEIDSEEVCKKLKEQKIMEINEEEYAFSPLGQYVMYTMGGGRCIHTNR